MSRAFITDFVLIGNNSSPLAIEINYEKRASFLWFCWADSNEVARHHCRQSSQQVSRTNFYDVSCGSIWGLFWPEIWAKQCPQSLFVDEHSLTNGRGQQYPPPWGIGDEINLSNKRTMTNPIFFQKTTFNVPANIF